MGNKKKKYRHMCRLCHARFTNEQDYAAHYVSAFHKFMTTLKQTQITYVGNAKTLDEQITEVGKKEPLIGLEYIYEYAEDSQGLRIYECKLCRSVYKPASIFFHIVGIEHRTLYLAKHHPIMGIDSSFEVGQQGQYRKLANNALAIEQTHGRKKINVLNEVYVSKPDVFEFSDTESIPDVEGIEVSEDLKDPKPKTKKISKSKLARKERRARERLLKLQEEAEAQQHADDDMGGSWPRDHEREPLRDSGDVSRLLQDQDFDARSLNRPRSPVSQYDRRDDARVEGVGGDYYPQSRFHDAGPVYHSDNRDVPKFPLDTVGGMAWQYKSGGGTEGLPDTRVGPLAPHGLDSAPPYQKELPFPVATEAVPPVSTALPLLGVAGSIFQDDFDDVDLRAIAQDQSASSVLPKKGDSPGHKGDRSSSRKTSSAASSDTKDYSRRRKHSPDSRSKKHKRETQNENCGDIDVRSVLPSGGVSFKELREAFEKDPNIIFSSAHLPLCKKKKKDKETDSDLEVCSMDFSDGDPDEFWGNEELFDFLKCFYIDDAEDVKFVLEAIKQMSNALVRYKTRKEDLQKRILEEKQRLEEEKKAFLELKKRKLQKLTGIKVTETETATQPEQGTSTEKTATTGESAVQKPEEKVIQPPQVNLILKTAPVVQKAEKVIKPQQVTPSAKALVSGLGPLLQQLFQRVQDSANQNPASNSGTKGPGAPLGPAPDYHPNQNPASRFDTKGPGAPLGPAPDYRPNQNPASRFDTKGPGAPLGPAPDYRPNQNPVSRFDTKGPGAPLGPAPDYRPNQNPVSRFDTKGPGAPLGPAPDYRPNQNPASRFDTQGPVVGAKPASDYPPRPSRFDIKGPVDGTKPVSDSRPNPNPVSRFDVKGPGGAIGPGSETHFGPNQQIPGPRFGNPYPPKNQTPFLGQGHGAGRYPESDSHFNQNPGPRFDNRGPGTALGPGSEPRFSQTQQVPGSRFNNSNPSNDSRGMGQGAGRYSEPDSHYKQNEQYPGPRVNSSGYQDKTKPPLGAAPETPKQPQQQAVPRHQGPDSHFNQNPGPHFDNRGPGTAIGPGFNQTSGASGPRYDNPGPSKEQRPMVGQAAGRYSEPDSHYKQNQQYPGPWANSSGYQDKTKPPLGAAPETPKQPPQQAVPRYQGPDKSFNQNPGPHFDNRGPGPALGPGFNQTTGVSGPRYDNPGPSKELRPMVGQAAGRYSEPDSHYKQNEQFPGSRVENTGYQDKTKPPQGAGSDMRFNQTPGVSGPRYDTPGPSKEQRPIVGQAAGKYSEPPSYYKQNEQFPGSRVDNSGYYDKTKPPLGAGPEMHYNQTPGASGPRYDNSGPSKEPRPMVGQGAGRYSEPNSHYKQNEQFSGSQVHTSGYYDKTKPPQGAGSDMHFNQTLGISGTRYDSSGPSKEPRPMVGQGAGRYSEPDSHYKQNEQFPGSRVDNTGYYDKTKPTLGSGFSQTPGISSTRYDNPGPSKEPRPMVGQAAGGYSATDSRFNQNQQFPGPQKDNSGFPNTAKPPIGAADSRFNQNQQFPGPQKDNSGFHNAAKPPIGADANYKPTQWNSGPQTGSQGFPASGMGAGRYGEPYPQNQWQSQSNSKGASGETRSGPGPQSHPPPDSTGFSSDKPQGTWASQDPPKSAAYPRSILKNRTQNLP
ncbi:collagen alpha-1(I) chain-like isoform X3 [Dendropsophus ebraccatus]|uniref:collagen alpha-1(I) chain-like isoform X3 n=1 Tax=Dendropsophus ebraccatus TaxID=150705 RepID=UPI003831B26F